MDETKDKLKNKNLIHCEEDVLDYALNDHFGIAILNNKEVIPEREIKKGKKCNWYDRVKCEVCGGEFIRSARSQHKKTKLHLAYFNLNDKLKNILLGNINKEEK